MKRIQFITVKKRPCFKRQKFILRMLFHRITVKYLNTDKPCSVKNDTLYITDNRETETLLKRLGTEPVILIDSEDGMDEFSDCTYFVMDPEETEYLYYDRVYRRIHNIPWEMIKTKRLILRETCESDVDAFYEIYRNPEMTRFTEKLYDDPEEEKKYVSEYRKKVYEVQGFGIWTVIRRSDNRIIGRAGLTAREGFENLEVGFAIGCEYQKQGYAFEAVSAILDFAKENELGRICACVMPKNEASKRLLMKAGFKIESGTTINGEYYDVWFD